MSWVRKAVLLGFAFYIAVLLVKPIGVSTQFSVLSGIFHRAVNEDIIWEDSNSDNGYASSNAYYNRNDGKIAKAIENPWNYDFVFVLAIPFGACMGMSMFRKERSKSGARFSSKDISEYSGNSFIKEYGSVFVAGFLILFGARMADGCTSGHMMSGMMQGSLSGYIFAASVFLTAIPTAVYVGNRIMKKIIYGE